MGHKLTMKELQRHTDKIDTDTTDLTYEELREQLNIKTCKYCSDEFVTGWTENFCTESCEVEYLHKNNFV